MSTDPGWYPSPDGQPGLTYWNGHEWVPQDTGEIKPVKSPRVWPLYVTIGVIGVTLLGLTAIVVKPRDVAVRNDSETTTVSTTLTPTMTPKAQLRQWAQGAKPQLEGIFEALERVEAGANGNNVYEIAAGCSDLAEDLSGLQAKLPTPSPEVNVELQGAIDSYGQAAERCRFFDGTTTQPEIEQAGQLMGAGAAHIKNAVGIIQAMQ